MFAEGPENVEAGRGAKLDSPSSQGFRQDGEVCASNVLRVEVRGGNILVANLPFLLSVT